MPATTALLEREGELATIERAFHLAASGDGCLLMVEGEAGAGKTSLLDAAARLGRGRGMSVLRARGGEYERDFPYGVVRQLFEPLLADDARRAELLVGTAAMAAPIFGADASDRAEADPFGVQHGLYWLLSDLAEGAPLTLLIDDAQWADLSSLRTLTYVARRLEGLRVTLVLAVRTGEPGPHGALLDEIRRESSGGSIVPKPLSEEAAGKLVAGELAGSPEGRFITACHRASAGNPLLLGELLHTLREERVAPSDEYADRLEEIAAAGLSRSVVARLDRLGEPAVQTAEAIAILEPNAEPRHVVTLTGLAAGEAAEACSRLIGAGLIEDVDPLCFVHPLVRSAVYAAMSNPRRAVLHAEAARRLAAAGAPMDSTAAHLLLAQPAADAWVVETLRDAARRALERGVPGSAVEYLRRALHEPPAEPEFFEVSRELGSALLRCSDDSGIEILLEVRSRFDTPAIRAEIANELAISLGNRRRHDEATSLLVDAIAEVGDASPFALQLRSMLLFQATLGGEGVHDLSLPGDGEELRGETMGARSLLSHAAVLFAAGLGEMRTAEEFGRRALSNPSASREDALAGYPPTAATMALGLADRLHLLVGADEFLIEASRRRGVLNGIGANYATRAACRALAGDLLDAEADAKIAIDLIDQGLTGIRTNFMAVFGFVAIERGELEVAEERLYRDPATAALGAGFSGALVLCQRGALRLTAGQPGAARDDFVAAAEMVDWMPFANPETLGWRTGLARAEAMLGNQEQAERVAAEAVDVAERAGGRRGIGLALRVQGSLFGGSDGIETLREAVGMLGDSEARLQHAHALVELGAALRRANHRKEAREPLREGLDLAHRCGAAPLEERARAELAATGARPRKAVLTGVESLTPSELRVARLAAEGMTNREIAQQLFVTAKTVETHLRHVFQKLDVSRRTELAGALG